MTPLQMDRYDEDARIWADFLGTEAGRAGVARLSQSMGLVTPAEEHVMQFESGVIQGQRLMLRALLDLTQLADRNLAEAEAEDTLIPRQRD